MAAIPVLFRRASQTLTSGQFANRTAATLVTICALLACAIAQTGSTGRSKGGAMAFTLNSGSFNNGQAIPREFTCDGSDASPALSWTGAPEGTKSFALIVDDPDAPSGIFTHWVIYDIPVDASKLPQGMAKSEEASGARQGRNSFGKIGYGGPCPPPGKPHRYFFKLFALGKPLSLKPGASKQELERAMSGAVVGAAELMGTYGRSKS